MKSSDALHPSTIELNGTVVVIFTAFKNEV